MFAKIKLHVSTFLLAIVVGASFLWPSSANAIVIGGGVTAGGAFSNGGVFQELSVPFGGISNPPNTVGSNNFQSNNLFAFNEDQNIALTNPLVVDIGTNLAAGQTVASHYVFFDPAGFTSITGFVDFDAPIIGVATSVGTLNSSDILLNNLVTYLSPNLRGLEGGDFANTLISGINNTRLELTWSAGSPGDYVRVFTQFSPGASPVPVPAALPLFAGGLGLLGFLGWRRKRATN